jgi:hypothetical protein
MWRNWKKYITFAEHLLKKQATDGSVAQLDRATAF